MHPIQSTTLCFVLSAVLLVPALAQKAAPSRRAVDLVTIVNTGDRLSPGYRITVRSTGAVEGIVRARGGKVTVSRKDQMIAPARDRFFEALRQAEPLSGIPTAATGRTARRRGGRVGGTVSGPQVYLIHRGVQSPNLRAASRDSDKVLYQRVKQVIEVLRLPIPNVP